MSFVAELIVWIVIGLIGGTLAGLIVTQQRRGFGFFQNLGLGLVGALIGGGVFRIFGVLPGLDGIAISLRDVIAAIAGSLLLVVAFWSRQPIGNDVSFVTCFRTTLLLAGRSSRSIAFNALDSLCRWTPATSYFSTTASIRLEELVV